MADDPGSPGGAAANGFTLAPVPGAVAHAGARLVPVDVTDGLTTRRAASTSSGSAPPSRWASPAPDRVGVMPQDLPNAARVLAGLCDLRIPVTLTPAECDGMVGAMAQALAASRG
jgi:hypothetical protein